VLHWRMPVAGYRHAKMLQDAMRAGITVEDLARALASYDSGDALAAFDTECARGEMTSGVFVNHVVRTEMIITRATEYARQRTAKR
jgi:hypothetical protein